MSDATVTIYSTPTCGYCHMAKEYFKSKEIEYKEFDVSKDQDKAQEMVNKSGQMGVPVIEIKDKIIVGFDRPNIDAALKLQSNYLTYISYVCQNELTLI